MRTQLTSSDDGQLFVKEAAKQASASGPTHVPSEGLERIRHDLAAADNRGDRLAVCLAAARNEATRLRMAAAEAKHEKDTLSSAMARLHDRIGSRDVTISAMAEDLRSKEQELEEFRRRAGALQPLAVGARPTALDTEDKVQLAGLKRRLRAAEEDAALQRSLVNLLTAMLAVLSSSGRWWFALLPGFWLRNIKSGRLRKRALFDADLYAKRYPDVGQSGMDPLHHYVLHGLEEGRLRI